LTTRGRISGIEKLEELDELSAAVAVFDEGVDFPREQINCISRDLI